MATDLQALRTGIAHNDGITMSSVGQGDSMLATAGSLKLSGKHRWDDAQHNLAALLRLVWDQRHCDRLRVSVV